MTRRPLKSGFLVASQVVRLAVEAGACVGAQEGAPTPLVGARGDQADSRLWEQCITPLAAATLTHLLFHGGPLLHHCLPPPLPVMEDLRQADAMSAELAACEGALAALLRLLPCVVSATEAYSHELPVEEFLFLVRLCRGHGGQRWVMRSGGVGGLCGGNGGDPWAPDGRLRSCWWLKCIHGTHAAQAVHGVPPSLASRGSP